jgi:transposase-like protein
MAQFDYQSLIARLSAEGFDSGEFVRQLVERGYQELIDAGAAEHIGAARHERTRTRRNQRNGSRKRTLATAAGDIALALPKLRSGSYYPEFMEKRRRIDRALYAVVMTAYIEGVSTRRVDELVRSLGVSSGISRS